MSDAQMSMDAILDAALDELDDDDDDDDDCDDPDDKDIKVHVEAKGRPVGDSGKVHPSEPKTSTSNTAGASPDLDEDEMEQLKHMMNEIMRATISGGAADDDALGQVMTKLQQQMAMEMEQSQMNGMPKTPPLEENEATDAKKPVTGPEPPSPPRPVFGPEPPPPRSTDVDRTISNLLNGMAAAAVTKVDDAVENDDDDIDEMMKQFQSLGGDEMIDGMMQQLLAKDLMYEPIKEVTAKFPKWLEDNKETLTDDEYHNRCLQYKSLQDLVAVYETEPDNSDKIFASMKDVQEYGLPPPDIVADIAPDLSLDDNGVPQLNGMPDCCVM